MNRSTAYLCGLVACVFLLGPIAGAAAQTGQVSGTVTDASTHAAIQGVEADVYDSSGSFASSSTTDATGRYSVGGLGTGAYRVGFTTAFGTASNYAPQFYNNKPTLAAADPVAVTDGQTTSSIDAALQAGAQITGTVTDAATHAGVANVDVEIYDSGGNAVTNATTDTGGHYTAASLATGTVRIGIFPGQGYAPQYFNSKPTLATADPVSVTAGQITSADAALQPEAVIAGRVTDAATGSAIQNIQVDVYDQSGSSVSSVLTDSTGSYAARGLATGSYKVGFTRSEFLTGGNDAPQFYNGKPSLGAADPVSATSGQTTNNINAAIQPGGQISGVVTDASTNQAVANVGISASDATGAVVSSASTDAQGHYSVTSLATGSYTVAFDPRGTNHLPQYWNAKPSAATADPVSVTAGATTSGINAAVQPGGQITGTITDAAANAPTPGVLVTVYDASGTVAASTFSDPAGHYTAFALPTGNYRVGFSATGGQVYAPQYSRGKASLATADVLAVTAGQTVTGVDAAMSGGGSIAGVVTDAVSRAALAGVTVEIDPSSDSATAGATTDASGHYFIGGLPAGSHKVGFFSGSVGDYLLQFYNGKDAAGNADPVVVTLGQTTGNVDAALQPGGKVTGTVTNASTNGAIPGVQVELVDASQTAVGGASTDSSGHYTVGRLPTGTYRVSFAQSTPDTVAQYWNGKATFAAADPVAVTAGQTTPNINAALQPAGKIGGTVTDASTNAPIKGAQALVYDATGSFVSSGATDASGRYTVAGLPGGSYRVELTSPSDNNIYLTQYYHGQATLAGANAVSVTGGQTTSGIDAALQVGGKITGTVTDAPTQAPIQGVCVSVSGTTNGFFNFCATTDSSGRYAVAGLPAGTYKVGFLAGKAYLLQYFNNKPSFAAADAVSVALGSTTAGVDAALQPGGGISGTVTDASTHAALVGILARAYDSGGKVVASARSDSAGKYTLGPLGTGSFRVGFTGTRYLAQYYNGKATLAAADSVSVANGAITSGIDPALQPGGAIAGTVTDSATHAGIPRAFALVYDSTGSEVASASTDANGHYTVGALSAGSFKVQFLSPGDQRYLAQYYSGKGTLAAADSVSVTSGTTTGGIDGALQPAGALAGTVTDTGTHAAIQGLDVDVYDASGAFISSSQTDASGHYTVGVGSLGTGSYRVGFAGNGAYLGQYYNGKTSLSDANPVSVTAGATTPGIDAPLQPAGVITGTVTDASTGAVVSNVSVVVSDAGGGLATSTTTDATGQYHANGLATGAYKLSFVTGGAFDDGHLPQYYNGKGSLAAADSVAVTAGTTASNINAALQPAGRIAGTVTDASTHAAARDVGVTVYDATGRTISSLTTDSNGQYRIGPLAAGSYKVSFGSNAMVRSPYSPQYYSGKTSLSAADPISVVAGATTNGIDAALQLGSNAAGLDVTVTGGGTPIAGAEVLVVLPNAQHVSGITAGNGHASLLGLADGQYRVYAQAPGFTPGAGSVTVVNGAGQLSIPLTAGPVGSVQLTAHEMTPTEQQAAGINPNDPANQHVYEFDSHLAFVNCHGYANSAGFVGTASGDCPTGGGTFAHGDYTYQLQEHTVGGVPTLQWLIVPGRAHFLKEFIDVSMVVQNLASSDFKFDQGTATLTLPSGLSLAPTSATQTLTQPVADIPGGQSASVQWFIRGDTEGSYPLTAAYNALLEPFGTPISLAATLQTPLKIWGASALQMIIDGEAQAYSTYPYRVRIGLKNVADVPVYNPGVTLSTTGSVNYIYQPAEELTKSTDAIQPGETFWTTPYVLVPKITGSLDLSQSFVKQTGGDSDLHASVVSHPPLYTPDTAPKITATRAGDHVTVVWDPIANAASYKLYSTPDQDTQFPAAPIQANFTSPTTAVITVPQAAGKPEPWIAVSGNIAGRQTMIHPMIQASVPPPPPPPATGPTISEQGAAPNPSQKATTCSSSWPVNCATGTFWHTFTDVHVPGKGVPLDFQRTYTASSAASTGPLGYGWTGSYHMQLAAAPTGDVTIRQEDGATVSFTSSGGGLAAGPHVLASLVRNPDGTYTFTRFGKQLRYTFSAAGQLTREADRNGYETTLAYSGGNLASVTDPSGRKLTFAYSGSHLTGVTDPAGHTTSYTYDSSGNLASSADPLGRGWTFTYDAGHRMVSMTDPRGGAFTNTYDAAGRVTKQVDPAGRTTSWSYSGDPSSAAGSTTTMTNPRGEVTRYGYRNLELGSISRAVGTPAEATTQYQYDPATLGRVVITDPNGGVTKNTFDARGNLLSSTNQLDHTTTFTYDGHDAVTSVRDPLGVTTVYTYDATGNLTASTTPVVVSGATKQATTSYAYAAGPGEVTSLTDPDGGVMTLAYDGAGDRVRATDPTGATTTSAYDIMGRRTAVTAPNGTVAGGNAAAHTTHYAYDAAGQLTSQTDALGHTTIYGYDGDGNRASTTDANGHTTQATFDPDNEPVKTVRADGTELGSTFDADGNVVTQTDAAGHASSYAYDSLNRVVSTTDPNGKTTTYAYDKNGNRVTTTNADSQTTSYSYDGADRLIGIKYSDGTTPSVTETYDAAGQRTGLKDGTGTSSYTFDSLGRLTGTTDGSGQVVGYSYDLAGRQTSITYPSGKTVNRAYDAAGRLTSVTDWLGKTSKFAYDGDTNLTAQTDGNGVQGAFGYDNADRLTSVADANGSGSLASFTYTRDPVGQVATSATSNGATQQATLGRDKLDQLTSDGTSTYGYDPANNPTSFLGSQQTFDPANQLVSRSLPVTPPVPKPVPPPIVNPPPPVIPAVAVDSSVASNPGGISGLLTSPQLTTKTSGELIVAFVSVGGPLRGQRVTKISGASLKWSRVARATGARGDVEIWQALAPQQLTGQRVRARLRFSGYSGTITVSAFGGDSPRILAQASHHGRSGLPSVRIAGSVGALLWGAGYDPSQEAKRVPIAGQLLVSQALIRAQHATSWVQRLGTAVSAAGATKLGDKAPKATNWNFVAIAVGPRPTARRGSGRRSATVAATQTFGYNARGDRTSATTDGGSPSSLTYDQADRLTAVGTSHYAYDGDGVRTAKVVGSIATQFAWDRSTTVPQLLQDGGTAYIYGPGGTPVEQITGAEPLYLHQDQQGSTRVLTDASGVVVGRYDYDSWGNVTSHTGTATTALQYDGEYTDAETGYIYLRARYYDPSTGQFLTRDPIFPVTQSRYGYAGNDPADASDPTGTIVLPLLGAAVGGIAGGVVGGLDYALSHHGQFSGAAVAAGAIGGAATGGCIGLIGQAALCGAAGGAIGELARQKLSGESYDGGKVIEATFFGALGGPFGKALQPIAGPASKVGRVFLGTLLDDLTGAFGQHLFDYAVGSAGVC